MDINSVPQEDSSTYAKNKKAIYASDEDGNVKVIGSTGWNVEETATLQALKDLEDMAKDAYEEVLSGGKSTLYYHMYALRMDLDVLSQVTGFFKFTIKRDFKPEVFAKISDKRLEVYADVMDKTKEELKILEELKYDS